MPRSICGYLKLAFVTRMARGPVLALVAAFLISSSPLLAQSNQDDASMPAWTVLVLKLVSATHVQPTTGVVVSAPDLVLVPLDFAKAGDEILVLDGGTDIVRNGRPATIVHTLPADHLAILRVNGLERPAARLSSREAASLEALNIVAFPPAEMIAKGARPLREPVTVQAAVNSSAPTLEPFPNVTAALTDECGNLLAFNLSVGVQSLQPATIPRLAWAEALKRSAAIAGSSLQIAECNTESASRTETKPQPEPEALNPETAKQSPENPDQPGEESDSGTAAEQPEQESGLAAKLPESPNEAEMEPEPETRDTGDLASSQADANSGGLESTVEKGAGDESERPRQLSPAAISLAGLVILLLLGWWINRLRKGRHTSSVTGTDGAAIGQQASDEPQTVQFNAPQNEASSPVLKINGATADGELIQQQISVSGPDWQAEIGRQGADINLDSPTISRLHARLQLRDGRLTITDLDSTNGTQVKGINCLPGEEFFVQSGDSVTLGDITIQLRLSAANDPES